MDWPCQQVQHRLNSPSAAGIYDRNRGDMRGHRHRLRRCGVVTCTLQSPTILSTLNHFSDEYLMQRWTLWIAWLFLAISVALVTLFYHEGPLVLGFATLTAIAAFVASVFALRKPRSCLLGAAAFVASILSAVCAVALSYLSLLVIIMPRG
jgi:hypothetical protein